MIPQQLGLTALLVRFAGSGKVTGEDAGSEGTGFGGTGGVTGGGTEFSERGTRDTGEAGSSVSAPTASVVTMP
jgi:hypothetical protein